MSQMPRKRLQEDLEDPPVAAMSRLMLRRTLTVTSNTRRTQRPTWGQIKVSQMAEENLRKAGQSVTINNVMVAMIAVITTAEGIDSSVPTFGALAGKWGRPRTPDPSSGDPSGPGHGLLTERTYQPTWDDCQQLLQVLLTTEERQQVLLEARKNVPGPGGLPTQLPNKIDEGFPLTCPDWDYETAPGKESLQIYRQALLAGLKGAGKRPTNLTKVRTITQERDESPAAFMERLLEGFQMYTPLDPEALEHKATVAMAFIDQAALGIKGKLQRLDGIQTYGLQELVKEAEKVYNKRETPEEREARLAKEQMEREDRKDQVRDKHLTKILVAVPLTIITPHALEAIVRQPPDRWITNARLTHYQALLLDMDRVQFGPPVTLNPATLLPVPEDQPSPHDCRQVLAETHGTREDLKDQELPDADHTWYTDGSSYLDSGTRRAGAVVVDSHNTI
ncbi:uncharacterized protein [Macaca fascicularis]|uniref:uncharacterized protein n=1 Tax=Macaca fascicularis TaxID=9541 RepID=UPI0032B0795A